MTASPLMTTPRFSRRSASSSSESSSSLGALRLTNDSGTPLARGQSAEAIRRPWSSQGKSKLRLIPPAFEFVDRVDQLVFRIAPYEHARAYQRSLDGFSWRRKPFDVHAVHDRVQILQDIVRRRAIQPPRFLLLGLSQPAAHQVRSSGRGRRDLRIQRL